VPALTQTLKLLHQLSQSEAQDGRGLAIILQIIPVYAPAADYNNEAAYVLAVKQQVNTLRERKKQCKLKPNSASY